MRKKTRPLFFVMFSISLAYFFSCWGVTCTSVIVSRFASAQGVPIMWKNRDTAVLSNKVVFVKEAPYSYIGLVNANDASGRICYAGMNEQGFAIMNTVAYNLPQREGEQEDLEGFLMADALRKCSTISDFEALLSKNLGPDLGARANFGVIDSNGDSALFEVWNHSYKKIMPSDFSGKYIVNTNFARSGKPDKGAGYLRFDRATELFRSLGGAPIDFYSILHIFSRDIGNSLVKVPPLDDLKLIPEHPDYWVSNYDGIDRYSTSACVIFVGKDPLHPDFPATMWVIPGEPLTAIAVPLWVESGSVPDVLWKGTHSTMWNESARIKKIIRPLRKGNMKHYLRVNRLNNRLHTGYLPRFLKVEDEIKKETLKFLKEKHSPGEYASFQERMTLKALKAMKSVK